MTLIAPKYRSGAEYAFCYKSEAGMLSPEDDTIAADTTLNPLLLVGYTNTPGYTKPNALSPVRAAGMRAVAKFVGGRQEPVMSTTITLGDTAGGASTSGVKEFLKKAFAASGAGTHMCMPVIATAIAALDTCGQSGRSYQRLGRYGQINRLTLSFRMGAPVVASVEVWPLYINPAGGATMPTVSPSTIRTAGGEVFMYSDAALAFGSDDYTAHMRSFTITVDNMLVREGQRPYTQAGYLGLKPGSIYSLGQMVTLQTDQAAPFPDVFADGADNGAMTAVMTLGANSITLASTASYVDVDSQAETDPASPTGYGSQIVLDGLTIA